MKLRYEPEVPPAPRSHALLGGLLGLCLLLAARLVPWSNMPSLCGFRNLTGQPCPGCGMTRSWALFSHGQVFEAIQINPIGSGLFVALCLALVYGLLRQTVSLPAIRLRMTRVERRWFWTGLGALLLSNWAYTIITGVAA